MEVRRIQGSDNAYFGRFNNRTGNLCIIYLTRPKLRYMFELQRLAVSTFHPSH